jgi:hypothetical protein
MGDADSSCLTVPATWWSRQTGGGIFEGQGEWNSKSLVLHLYLVGKVFLL